MAKKHTHVYADANIYLDFFRFSEDDLAQLEKFIAHISTSGVELYLPQLTEEEYYRNRDKVLAEQINTIQRVSLTVGIPICVRELDQAKEFTSSLQNAASARSALIESVQHLASNHEFKADKLISVLFETATPIPTTEELLGKAKLRRDLHNPPGKIESLGDRLNWECLLSAVPDGENLSIVTRDGDFLADFKEKTANQFLSKEWKRVKGGYLSIHSSIKSFAKYVDDTLDFMFDPVAQEAITDLASSGSFYSTHSAIAELSLLVDKFTDGECVQILRIALDNSQVGGIMSDDDLTNFYIKIRAKLPWIGNPVADEFDDRFPGFSVPF